MSYFARTEERFHSLKKKVYLKDFSFTSVFPLLFLIAETSLALLYQNSLLVLLALAAFSLPLLYKKQGLIVFFILFGAFLCFIKFPTSSGELFWIFSLLLSLALTASIVFLIHSEKERVALKKQQENEQAVQLAMNELKTAAEQLSQEKQALEEAIERLKDEAKQRRIEKQMQDQLFAKLREDLESFHNGREELIASSLAVKEENLARLRELEERARAEVRNKEEASSPVSQVSVQLVSDLDEHNVLASAAPDPITSFEPLSSISKENLVSENQARGLYKQLRSQFEEKTKLLSSVRQELFLLEGKLHCYEKAKENTAFEPQDGWLINEFQTLLKANENLEEEIKVLEELIFHAPHQ